ncbi:2',3'-cyclic-nucleotide 3'-phosphodiesterase isoform X1 [Petromyzon marinus]|uniref:2',3'-cyclic-nucleotide 3'-phosphodiesterase isoform X1 n=2 Tax=Petromyzon marinus TaxID=7757 RepID=UPI003F70A562
MGVVAVSGAFRLIVRNPQARIQFGCLIRLPVRNRFLGSASSAYASMASREVHPPPGIPCGDPGDPYKPGEGPAPTPLLLAGPSLAAARDCRLLVVLRGLPGSGKSTLCARIAAALDAGDGGAASVAVVSADETALTAAQAARHHDDGDDDGDATEETDEDEAKDPQKRLRQKIRKKCAAGVDAVIVDGTNHVAMSVLRLGATARSFGYLTLIVCPTTPWRDDCCTLASKTHWGWGVQAIEALRPSLQEALVPLYFGWFLTKGSVQTMCKISDTFLLKIAAISEFASEFQPFMKWQNEQDQKMDLGAYFRRSMFVGGPNVLHCTAMFCANGEVPGSEEYATSQAVQESCGHAFVLQVTALLVTPRTVGARVQLSAAQMALWDPNDCSSHLDNHIDTTMPTQPLTDCTVPNLPRGSRAHISLGCAPGVEPVQTGVDLLDILKCSTNPEKRIKLSVGELCCYGAGRWIVNLNKGHLVTTLFTGAYAQATRPVCFGTKTCP